MNATAHRAALIAAITPLMTEQDDAIDLDAIGRAERDVLTSEVWCDADALLILMIAMSKLDSDDRDQRLMASEAAKRALRGLTQGFASPVSGMVGEYYGLSVEPIAAEQVASAAE